MARDDLAAMLARAARRLADAERPLLDAHGLSMWEYVTLSHLAGSAASTQLELAAAIRYDKTRLIALLDRLEAEGLVVREVDPADRRGKNVRLSAVGAARHAAAQRDIRRMEQRELAHLDADERRSLLAVLPRLAPGEPSLG